ncbi:MAG: hypothetical protein MJ234_03985 [bacterium]|nr:hypothetical protein [bacterium]
MTALTRIERLVCFEINNMVIKNTNKASKRKGFTIHELMISLFLINMVAFALLAVVSMLLKSSQHVNQNSKAAIAASSILDKYIAGEMSVPENDHQIISEEEFSGQKFYYKIEVKEARESKKGIPGINQITIRVSADERLKSGHTEDDDIVLTTLQVTE